MKEIVFAILNDMAEDLSVLQLKKLQYAVVNQNNVKNSHRRYIA